MQRVVADWRAAKDAWAEVDVDDDDGPAGLEEEDWAVGFAEGDGSTHFDEDVGLKEAGEGDGPQEAHADVDCVAEVHTGSAPTCLYHLRAAVHSQRAR